MMNIKDISLPTFIWYILPGINAIALLVLTPLAVMDLPALQEGVSWSSVVGWLLGGLIIGFLLDSMKIYKLTPGYSAAKREFFQVLSRCMGGKAHLGIDHGKEVFRAMRLLLTEKGGSFPLWEHSRWVMINHTGKAALVAGAAWAVLFVFQQDTILLLGRYPLTSSGSKSVMAVLCVFFLALWLRLERESRKVLAEANALYLHFARVHKDEIRRRLAVEGSLEGDRT